jgi:hypothetical protein
MSMSSINQFDECSKVLDNRKEAIVSELKRESLF